MKGRTKKHIRRSFALTIVALILAGVISPLTAFAAISPLPTDNVGQTGAASTAFRDDGGKYSTWEDPSSGFAVSPEFAYRFKQSDATFTPFGKRDSAGGEKAAKDHGYPDTSSDDYYMFPVGAGDNKEGEIGFKATDLKIRNPVTGVYDKVDMTVTVTDWTLVSGSKQQYIFLEKHSRTAVLLCDVKELKLKIEYFVAGTDKRYNVKANLTYNDIDNKQYVGFKANDADYLYADKKSQLSYAKVDGYYVFYAENHEGNDQTGTPELAAGITFNTHTLDFVFGTNENFSDNACWSYFSQYAYTMANIEPGAPVKLVSDTDEKEVQKNTLKTMSETFTYKVIQPVPAGLSDDMRYSVFRFEDQIDTCLQITGVSVSQEGHGDRTDWFDIVVSGNKVTAAAKTSALGDENFYGGSKRNDTEFVLNIKVKIDPAKSEQLHTHGGGTGHYNAAGDLLTFENTASTTIRNNVDTYTQNTNKVTTTVALPSKNVSDSDESKVSENRITNANEPFIYRIRQAVLGGMDGEDAQYKSFVLSDVLDSCLKLSGAKVILDDESDVTGQFDVSVSGNSVIAAAKASALASPTFYGSGKGTGYTLLIEATLDQSRTIAELKAHGHYNASEDELAFSNTGTVTIDGSPETSNTVKTKVGVPDLEITKSVDRYEHQVTDRVKYTVSVKHTARSTSDATSVVIKDVSLPEGFSIDPESLKVSGIASANRSFATVKGGFEFKSDVIAKNETAVITFDAIPSKEQNGKIIGNTASVTAYSMIGEKKAGASVYINSPKLDLVKTTHKAEYKVGETISYNLALMQINPGTFMRDVIISDSITQSGVTLLPGSIQVIDENGKVITHLCDVTVSGNAFTVVPHLNMGYADKVIPPKEAGIAPYTSVTVAKKMTVTYDVAVSDQALSGLSVKNIAISPSRPNTNGDVIKDDPDIPSGGDIEEKDTPIIGAKLKIGKSSDKDIYKANETAKYTLKVTQIREDYTARNVVIRDAFETTLASIKEGSVKVTLNKKDITTGCAITVSGGALEIVTGKDLAWDDTINVVYSVTFDSAAVGQAISNIAIARADNAGEAQDENTVGVEPGAAALKIVKTSDKQTYKVGEIAVYSLEVSCISSSPAINVIVADKLEVTGAPIIADSVKVLLAGKDITSGSAITVTEQELTIETGKALTEGERLLVTYGLLIESPELAEKNIKNIAVASSSNSKDAEDDNVVGIESSKAALKIEKASDRQTYKAGDTAKYSLKVTCVTTDPAIGVVISDKLDTTGASISSGSVRVSIGDMDITSGCAITASPQAFTIDTGFTLTKGEEILVAYDVLLTDKSLAGKEIKNTAAAGAENTDEATADHTISVTPDPDEPDGPDKDVPGKGDTPNTPGTDTPKTGDNGSIPALILIIILSVAGAIAGSIYLTKKSKLQE